MAPLASAHLSVKGSRCAWAGVAGCRPQSRSPCCLGATPRPPSSAAMTAAAPRTALTLFRDGKRPRPAAPSRGSCHGSCRSPQGYSAFPGCAVSGGGLQNRHVYDREATRGAGRFRERPRGRGNIHPFSFCARSASGLVGTLLFLTLACGWAPLCLVCGCVHTACLVTCSSWCASSRVRGNAFRKAILKSRACVCSESTL